MDAVLDAPRAAAAQPALSPRSAPSASAAAAAAAPRGPVFECVLPAGPLRLRVEAPALAHALDAAIALQRCEPQLQALEDWIGRALDWRWTEIPMAPAERGSQVRAAWQLDAATAAGEPVAARGSIELPWALLRTLPAPGPALAAVLRWPLLPAQLVLSCPRLAAEDLALLEPGGALLLPESFDAATPWRGRLRAAGERGGAGLPVALEQPLAPRLPAGAEGAPAAAEGLDVADAAGACGPGPACEVLLDLPHGMGTPLLAGWQGGAVLAQAGPGAALWLREPGQPALCAARGRLMPWGGGWALAIEALGEAEDATLPVY
ncbi:hypothetical protein [Azohydromonas aeria]|uniref:hypothetical protein n=1 Tax=Azohydromonas aeria TaxID=2590212 RepID=UPI0012FCFE3E|nr:hypothetical protein [Azohydromonas aeria]